jgi:hypothetical protein
MVGVNPREMLFWRGRLRVDFLPSFELISGVTRNPDECGNAEPAIGLSPWLFDTLGQIRDEGLVRTRPHTLRWPQPERLEGRARASDRNAVDRLFFTRRTRRRPRSSVRFRLKLRRSAWASRKSVVSKPSVN